MQFLSDQNGFYDYSYWGPEIQDQRCSKGRGSSNSNCIISNCGDIEINSQLPASQPHSISYLDCSEIGTQTSELFRGRQWAHHFAMRMTVIVRNQTELLFKMCFLSNFSIFPNICCWSIPEDSRTLKAYTSNKAIINGYNQIRKTCGPSTWLQLPRNWKTRKETRRHPRKYVCSTSGDIWE